MTTVTLHTMAVHSNSIVHSNFKYKSTIEMAILKGIYLTFLFLFSASLYQLKALSVCADGFWIRTNFVYEVRWQEGISMKISLASLYSDFK